MLAARSLWFEAIRDTVFMEAVSMQRDEESWWRRVGMSTKYAHCLDYRLQGGCSVTVKSPANTEVLQKQSL